KLPGYILPAVPAWAILAAEYLQEMRERNRIPWAVLLSHAVVVGACVTAALHSPYLLQHSSAPMGAKWAAAASGIGFFAIGLLVVRRNGTGALRFVTSAA